MTEPLKTGNFRSNIWLLFMGNKSSIVLVSPHTEDLFHAKNMKKKSKIKKKIDWKSADNV